MSKNKKKKKGGLIALLIILVVIVIAAGTAFWMITKKCSEVFIDGTALNTMEVGGLTLDEAKKKLSDKVESYTITVNFRDGNTEVLGKDELGLTYDDNKSVDELLASQNAIKWIKQLFGTTFSYTVDENFVYNDETISDTVRDIAEKAGKDAPKNAYMTIENNQFVIVPEEEGNFLKTDNLKNLIEEQIMEKTPEITLTDYDDMYGAPEVRADNPELNEELAEYNAILSTNVIYHIKMNVDNIAPESNYIFYNKGAENPILRVDPVEGDEITSQVSNGDYDEQITGVMLLECFREDDGRYTFDEAARDAILNAFVDGMAAKYNATSSAIEIKSTKIGVFGMPVQRYGQIMDTNAEKTALIDNFNKHESADREPAWEFKVDKPEAPTTYIEVDKTNQHMYYYVNGNIALETDVVTGLESTSKRRTPCGFYYIYMKQRERDLKGQIDPETGEPSYISHVAYWMPFYYGYGLHDANWRGSFGGNIYTYGGSHGCVNMPPGKAGELYGMLEVGTPVYVLKAK